MTKKIAKKIKQWDKIALFHHINPDGDSISCSYGMALALKEIFPQKEIVLVGEHEYLEKNFSFLKFDKSFFKESIDQTYLTIIGDTSAKDRISKYEEYLKGGFKICFDHHQNDITAKHDIFWHEPNYPASALQTNLILDHFQQDFSENTSLMLLFGILTDTGFFKFSTNNTLAPIIFVKRLSQIKHKTMLELYTKMSLKTKKDIEIQKHIFDSIKYNQNVAYVIFDKKTVKKYGIESIKWKINSISHIEGTNIWTFFIPNLNNHNIEVHLRSSGPKVNEVAIKFGGGGHFRAAGAKISTKEEIQNVIKELIKINKT